MRRHAIGLLAAGGLGLAAASAMAVEIQSVAVEAPTKAHLCRALGGAGKDPVVTIRHAPVAGDTISVHMYDIVSGGRVVDHFTRTVKSEADGTTVLKADFLPPCNQTAGRLGSSYRFDVKSKGSRKVTKRWFDYDSGSGRIMPK